MTKFNLKISRVFAVGLLLFPAFFAATVYAQGQILADPSDFFSVSAPGPNVTVSGNVTTIWRNYDNNQSDIPYELTLRDSQTCNTLRGTISVGTKPSSSGTDASVTWASGGPLSDAASIPDGAYCMQLCISLRNGSNPYSACNLRIINIRNTNIPPQIVSSPPADRTITVNESWQYQVQASDANGDAITYSLLNNPGFLTINAGTGMISTNSNAKNPGTYTITVVARDSYGGTASQEFQLVVTAATVTPPPAPPAAPGNQAGSVTIVLPVTDAELSGDKNQITWEATDPEGIKEIRISYSTDQVEWIPIATLPGDKTSYNWDVLEVEAGEYYLRVEAVDNQDAISSDMSGRFEVVSVPENIPGTATKPLIISVRPEDGSSISERRPTITGDFTPPAGGMISATSFVLKIDEKDVSDICTVTVSDFSCIPEEDLSLGVHKVRAEVKSNDDQTAVREWTFTIITPAQESPVQQTSGVQVNSQLVTILLIACCLLSLLLIIPWILYVLWRRRSEEVTETYAEEQTVNPAEFATYQDYLSAASAPIIPEITTNYYTPEPMAAAPSYETVVNVPESPVSAPIEETQVTTYQPAPAPVADSNAYVTSPDFMSYYNPQPTTGIENADADVPDWLKAPETTTTTTTVSAAPIPVASPAPIAPVSEAPVASELPPVPTFNDVPSTTTTTTTTTTEPLIASTPTDFTPLPPATGGDPGNESGSYGYGRQVDNF
jgi:hypothetical protein